MKRKAHLVLAACLVMLCLWIPQAVFAGTTGADTPTIASGTGMKWQAGFLSAGMNFSKVPTPPALAGGCIYYGSRDKIYKLDRETGKVLAESPSLPSTFGWAMMPVTFDDPEDPKYVYAFLDYCRFVRLNASDLSKPKSGWFESEEDLSQKNMMQNNCYCQYVDGRLYSGTWRGDKLTGEYFSIDAETGKTAWKIGNTEQDAGGYYWTGVSAVKTEEGGTRVLFGGDDGYFYSVRSDASQADFEAADNGAVRRIRLDQGVRCIPAVDQEAMRAYVVTTDEKGAMDSKGAGSLYRIDIASDGALSIGEQNAVVGSSKNPPVLAGQNVYVAGWDKKVYAFDKDDLSSPKLTVTAPAEVKGEMLVSERNGVTDIYATYNSRPGGIFCIETDPALSRHEEKVIFTPAHMEWCISPLIADEKGVIYYKNDSGFIMAVTKGEDLSAVKGFTAKAESISSAALTWDFRANVKSYEVLQKSGSSFKKIASVSGDSYQKAQASYTVTGLKEGTKYTFSVRALLENGSYSQDAGALSVTMGVNKPKAPAKFKAKAGKKKITLTWKKTAKASGYVIYRAVKKKGKYKKIKTIKKASVVKYTDKKLKKGKKYYYKIRAFRKVNGKTIYGPFSGIVYKKVK